MLALPRDWAQDAADRALEAAPQLEAFRMRSRRDDVIYRATGGCALVAAGSAIALMLYALLTFLALLPSSPVRSFVQAML